jgi:hypothetical protein
LTLSRCRFSSVCKFLYLLETNDDGKEVIALISKARVQGTPWTQEQYLFFMQSAKSNLVIRSAFRLHPKLDPLFLPRATTSSYALPTLPFDLNTSVLLHPLLFNALCKVPAIAFPVEHAGLIKQLETGPAAKTEAPVGREEAKFLVAEAAKITAKDHEATRNRNDNQKDFKRVEEGISGDSKSIEEEAGQATKMSKAASSSRYGGLPAFNTSKKHPRS